MSLFSCEHSVEVNGLKFSTNPVEDDPNLQQIWPAGAENNPTMLEDVLAHHHGSNWAYEEKFDGERLLIHFQETGNRVTTRRQSKKTGLMNERTNNVPHIRGLVVPELAGTVLDGEIINLNGKDTLGLTQSAMNSLPDRAISLQKEHGWLVFKAFDCLFYKGEDIRAMSGYTRKSYLSDVLEKIRRKYPESKAYFQESIWYMIIGAEAVRDRFDGIVRAGGEGLVLKDMSAAYGQNHSWLKMKKAEYVDAFVTGWEKGNGRNSEVCGYLKFSVWNESKTGMVEIARVGALDDETRIRVAENFDDYRMEVAELKMQEVTKDLRLRHPRINRWRPDKSDSECTLEKVKSLRKEGAE